MSHSHPFFDHIRAQHPSPDHFDEFISACHRPLRKSIRVNTLKISVEDFQSIAEKNGWLLNPIPWCSEGFWIEVSDSEQFQLGNCGEHLMGLFYIQEASSMLPPVALLHDSAALANPQALILDMAAAPGSKTTQLAALMQNKGTILANELSASRLKVLHANLQRTGVTNVCISHFDGTHLHSSLAGSFDAILLDAPCGGEGTYRKDPKALDNWSLDAIENISSLQKQLIISAWKMLKPGGRLIYSTCTLSSAENQQVVHWLNTEVKESLGDELSIINLASLFPDASKVITPEGFIHVWPEIFDCEGFFVACLEKNQSASVDSQTIAVGQSPFKDLDAKTQLLIADYFQQHFDFNFTDLTSRLRIRVSHHEQQIWLFPEHGEELRNTMRLQRSGIRVCDLIESRKGTLIKTCHEFIICYGDQFNRQFVELNATEAEACCKGDNIVPEISTRLDKGEVIMRYQGIPLGLAKVIPLSNIKKNIKKNIKIKLKNNLPRDLLRTNATFLT